MGLIPSGCEPFSRRLFSRIVIDLWDHSPKINMFRLEFLQDVNDNGVAFQSVSLSPAIFLKLQAIIQCISNIFRAVQAWSGSHFRLQLIEGCWKGLVLMSC